MAEAAIPEEENKTVKYGIIGVGMMGKEHLINLYYLRDHGVSVVCIADPHPPSLDSAIDLAHFFNWTLQVSILIYIF